MVEVFRTDVRDAVKADIVKIALYQYLGYSNVVIDLQDGDRILRIEAGNIQNDNVISVLEKLNCKCEVLPD